MARSKKELEFAVTVDGDISGLKRVMNEAVKVFNSTDRALKNVREALKLDPNNTELMIKEEELLAKKIRDGEQAAIDLQKAMDKIVNDPNFKKGSTELNEKFTELQKKLAQVQAEVKKTKTELSTLQRLSPDLRAFGTSLKKLGDDMYAFSMKTRYLSMMFAALTTGIFNATKNYETEVAGIRRVVKDLTEETIADLKDVAVETGTAFDEIADVATMGGALGIAEKDLSAFTKTMTDLNVATGGAFSGEEGAKAVVVFLKQLGLSIDQLENFGSAIAVIGDKYADVGSETLDLATALSGIATIAKVDQYDLIGLAGVMADLGLKGEAATSAITRSFAKVEEAIASGGKSLTAFAEASGMTTKQFKDAWSAKPMETFMKFVDGLSSSAFNDINDAVKKNSSTLNEYAKALDTTGEHFKQLWEQDAKGTFNKYIEGLETMDDAESDAIMTLKNVKLSSIRTTQVLLRMAGSGQEVAKATQLANQAWNENTALAEKANGIYDTTERKMTGMWEALKQTGASIGNSMLPFIKNIVDDITLLAQKFAELDPTMQQLILVFASYGAVLSPVTRVMGGFAKNLGAVLTGTEKFSILLGGTSGVIALIGALTAAMIYLAKVNSVDPIREQYKALKELRKEYDETIQTLDDVAVQQEYNYVLGKNNSIQIEKDIQRVKELDKAEEGYQKTLSNKKAKTIDTINATHDLQRAEAEEQDIKDRIKQKVDLLNESLGDTIYYYDEVSNAVYRGEEPVKYLTEDWNELTDAMRKSFYVENYKEQYETAIKNQQEILNKQKEAALGYKDILEQYGEGYEKWVDIWNDSTPEEFSKAYAQQSETEQKAISEVIAAYTRYKLVIGETGEQMAKYQNDIDAYMGLFSNVPEDVDRAMDSLLYGFSFDPAKNAVEDIEGTLSDLQFILDHPAGYSEDFLNGIKAEIEVWQKELDLAKQVQNEWDSSKGLVNTDWMGETVSGAETGINEIYNGADGLVATNNEAVKAIDEANRTSVNTFVQDMVSQILEEYERMRLGFIENPLTFPIQFDTGNGITKLRSYGYGSFKSGGFGNNMQSRGIGSVVVNNTFTVNNANGVTRSVLDAWADAITDRIDENLGRMYGV